MKIHKEMFAMKITSRLKEGEQMVVSGAYLPYSEFIMKKRKDPMAGMNR